MAGQLHAAFGDLEQDLARHPLPADSAGFNQAGISIAVAWHFTVQTVADALPAQDYPLLAALSAAAEALPEFRAAPHGDDTYPVDA